MTADEKRVKEELYRACVRGAVEQVASILDDVPAPEVFAYTSQLDLEGSSSLHVAARYGHLTLLQELLRRGCQVSTADVHGRTPLHTAGEEGRADVALELLLGRANPDALDALHETALHKAVLADSSEVIEVLLDRAGADPSIGDGAGCTPALLAAERGKVDCLQLFMKKDPELANATNASGWTALHLAAHGDQHSRKITTKKPPKFLATVRLLLESKANIDARDEDTKTPLHRAALTGNLDSATALVEAGADLSAADICRWTPLHYACQDGHCKVVQMLLTAQAAVQCENPPCLTPLAVATMENQARVAELLMSFGADPNLKGKGLASPLMIARKDPEKYADILGLFELGFVKH